MNQIKNISINRLYGANQNDKLVQACQRSVLPVLVQKRKKKTKNRTNWNIA